MRKALLATSIFAATLVLAGTGTAQAAIAGDAVGGIEQITVSITTDEELRNALVYVDDKIQDVILSAKPQQGSVGPSHVLKDVKPGGHNVRMYSADKRGVVETILDKNIEVTKAGAPVSGSAGR